MVLLSYNGRLRARHMHAVMHHMYPWHTVCVALHLADMHGPGQLHRIRGVQLAVVLVQHGTAAEPMPLIEGDSGGVACLHVQVRALDDRVRCC